MLFGLLVGLSLLEVLFLVGVWFVFVLFGLGVPLFVLLREVLSVVVMLTMFLFIVILLLLLFLTCGGISGCSASTFVGFCCSAGFSWVGSCSGI